MSEVKGYTVTQRIWNRDQQRLIYAGEQVMRAMTEAFYEAGDINAYERARRMWNYGARGKELRGIRG